MSNILYPLIPFDMIIDTDVGILKLAKERYIDSSIYYYGILQLSIDILAYMLTKRKEVNPLSIAKKSGIGNSVIDQNYKEMIESDYDKIVSLSVTTDLFDAMRYFISSDIIIPTILCKNDIEADMLSKIKFEKKIAVEVCPPEHLSAKYDPIYIKDISKINRYSHLLDGKNIYIANYGFNFVEVEDNLVLPDDALEIISGKALPKIVSIYKIDTSNIPKG